LQDILIEVSPRFVTCFKTWNTEDAKISSFMQSMPCEISSNYLEVQLGDFTEGTINQQKLGQASGMLHYVQDVASCPMLSDGTSI
jgi:hypothetical protein